MSDPFTSRLKDFARTVDFLNASTFEQIEGSFYDYMKDALGASYYEVSVPEVVRGKTDIPTLKTQWCMHQNRRGESITLRAENKIRSQKSFCYEKNTRLWVTAKDKKSLLRECDGTSGLKVEGLDEGLTVDDLPAYRDFEPDNTGNSKTAICVPLFHENTSFGLMLVELPQNITYTKIRREHFQDLADSITKIFARYRASTSSLMDTKEAFQDVIRTINYEDCGLPERKPLVFFSYPNTSDGLVTETIKTVVTTEFDDDLELIDWKQISDTGSITAQIIESIRGSRYGICYLSEKTKGGDKRYRDNANVLFEAGMFHVLRSNRGETLRGWLPIREDVGATEEIPFNFANERILTVPRSGSKLDQDCFKRKLKEFIEKLLTN